MGYQDQPKHNNLVLQTVSDRRRRQLLQILADRSSPVSVPELATNIAADERGKALVDVTPADVEAVETDLVHVQLPKLARADLVDWDRSAGTATTTKHPALADPKFQQMIATNAPDWDAVVRNLASKRRRVILAELKEHDGAISRADLAKQVRTRERDDETDDLKEMDDILTALHHIHLPSLEQAGLVAYDHDSGRVSYTGHEALADEWLDFRPDETPRAIVPAAHHSDDIWTIEGRDNVIARGQSLFEQADEELFLMFTTDGLLEDGCLRQLQDAIDRGVDVYLGSQTQEVRDLVRESAPEVTIWEPQLDWLNLPPDHEKVGRLVMADREAIMLATLGAETGDGIHHRETAITGSSENNPLVILMRELLGSRLDHLDAQSEDFLEQIPL